MRLAISSGHAEDCQGADGYINEVKEATKVTDSVAQILTDAGHTVMTFHDTVSDDQSENLNRIVNWHNSQTRDLDVSVHFNAYQTTSSPMGCEVCYVTQSSLAARISDAMATAMDLPDRGAKYRSDLFFLNSTEMPAVLLEVCFVDSSTDTEHYHGNYPACCTSIAEALVGEELEEPGEQPPEVEVPPEPIEPPSMENRVDILGHVEGDVAVVINGNNILGSPARCRNVVRMRITMSGDVICSINGQDFHNTPTEQPPEEVTGPAANHSNIEATVFGGSDDPNNSAYPPYALLDGDDDDFVALPYSFPLDLFPDEAPQVRVYCGELSAVGRVADKGPWTVDDQNYVMGDARPIAETCHDEGAPLPSGPNAGKVPTNSAGIDLSPHLAGKIGVKGKGVVSWEFV